MHFRGNQFAPLLLFPNLEFAERDYKDSQGNTDKNCVQRQKHKTYSKLIKENTKTHSI